jgi:1-acyl-sn-glycerol-3-phosphate acyltransferase
MAGWEETVSDTMYLFGPSTLTQRLALRALRLLGWSVSSAPPPGPKGLIVVYPHTSNWDFVYGVLFRFGTAMPAGFLAKDSLFRGPFGSWLRRIGGVSVNRRSPQGIIERLMAEFRKRSSMWLAIPVEGTRAYTDHWKSGFYHLAVAGNLPVALGYIDYRTRTVGVDTYVTLTGDEEKDLAVMRDFYADKTGRHPERAGEIRLKPRKG